MVDERRLVRLLQRITNELGHLEGLAAGDRVALRADQERLAGLKYWFITTLEGVINVAQHVCASEGWGPPKDNGDAVRLLGQHGVIDAELAARVAGAVGFRNLLVHQYVDVDDDRVVAFLDEIGDVDAYVGGVTAWIG
ncbi:MAG: type VII toxin-antitoxin system HepT family RNase toxin [Acidimicrobiales bacterium]